MSVPESKSGRIYYLDLLRVIACFSVVMIHSSAYYVVRDIGSLNFWFANILDSLSRIGVPLFVMISGAMMLDENRAVSPRKLAKRIGKLIVFFLFWSAFYCLVSEVMAKVIRREPPDVRQVISVFVEGYVHLWFIYMIIGLYCIIPLLRLWVNHRNRKYVAYFLLLSFVFTFLLPRIIEIGSRFGHAFDSLKTVNSFISLRYVGGYTAYFLLGWYLRQYEVRHKTLIYILGLFGAAVSVFGTYFLSAAAGEAVQLYDNLGFNILFQTAAVFVFVKAKWADADPRGRPWVSAIVHHSLGIYAIHKVCEKMIRSLLISAHSSSAIVNIPVIFLGSFVLAYLSAAVMRRIPVLKNVV